jgi:hypothetical protein
MEATLKNPEGLTKVEIESMIKHLEKGIRRCLIFSGSRHCQNRIKRVEVLKSYLK